MHVFRFKFNRSGLNRLLRHADLKQTKVKSNCRIRAEPAGELAHRIVVGRVVEPRRRIRESADYYQCRWCRCTSVKSRADLQTLGRRGISPTGVSPFLLRYLRILPIHLYIHSIQHSRSLHLQRPTFSFLNSLKRR